MNGVDINKGNWVEEPGYTEEMAINEAKRCLSCKTKPCMKGCPLNTDIPDFIRFVADGKFCEAYKKINEKNSMPSVCGRVCNQKCQCEKNCVRGIKGDPISIGKLERFVADWVRKHRKDKVCCNIKSVNRKVAIIGSGPSGLVCAQHMCSYGYDVTIFEKLPLAGGVLRYGIPEFRLPKDIVDHEIQKLKDMGVEIKTNINIGEGYSVDDLLRDGFSAVYIATGAFVPKFMDIDGEDAKFVYQAKDFLTSVNLKNNSVCLDKHDVVAVIGGGNVAMDVARTVKRMNVDSVYVIYRRTKSEMPAREEEIEGAKEDGVIFRFLENPKRIIKDEEGKVCFIECVDMELSNLDCNGRRKVIEVKNSEHKVKVDKVIVAIGQSPNTFVINDTKGIDTSEFGGILVEEETFMSTKSGVFAGGDVVTGAKTVTLAVKAGRDAAKQMNCYIKNLVCE